MRRRQTFGPRESALPPSAPAPRARRPPSAASAHASSVAPVVLTSSTSTTQAPRSRGSCSRRRRHPRRGGANAPRTLRRRRCRAQAELRRRSARTRRSAWTTGRPRSPREVLRLVEPARVLAPPVQRHRHGEVRALAAPPRPALRIIAAERRGERPAPLVLQGVDHLAEDALVGAGRAGAGERPAAGAGSGRSGTRPGSSARQAGSASPQRTQSGGVMRDDGAPAGGADGAVERRVERRAAREAARREQDGEQAVGEPANHREPSSPLEARRRPGLAVAQSRPRGGGAGSGSATRSALPQSRSSA